MLTRISLFSALAAVGLGIMAPPVNAQALLPYVLPLDYERLEEQGLILAQDAAQLAQLQQYDLALAQAQLASQLLPDNAAIWGLLGTLYLQVEDFDASIEALSRAQVLESDNSAVLFALGTAHFRKGDYQKASDFLENGLSLEPDNAGALFDLGNTYFKLNQFETAIAQYQKSIELDPEFWPSVNNIGLVQYEQGEVDAAISRWQESLAIAPMEPEPELAIAVAEFARGNEAKALELGIPALEKDSRYAEIQFLIDNLWGPQLIADTEAFFEHPEVRAIRIQL
ncbi:tetratricopeptide repeat protein [Oscillatoria sp. CS-180]|uniref:tetratricopeptide repeat protein n=1 Tax=Oscillatoria sp. CS-180 TaxID=3021720 RepID=UPI00232AC2F3|nr:tetratricopeptide repeat protein [Oscillatoria sp. CS-180]MDB9528599.1 tetratricopeptide repeat protein [Oscillatoria sp. CS-180]